MIVAINMLNIVYHRLKALYPPSIVIPWIQIEIDYGMSLCFKPKIENRFGIFVVEKRQVVGLS